MPKKQPVLERYKENPIITPDMMPFDCYTVFNAGAVRFKGKYLLLLRAEGRELKTYFYTAVSGDGIHFKVSPEPINYPQRDIEKKFGGHRFDMRITCIDGKYYVCHAIWIDSFGCSIGTAETEDFVNFKSIGTLSVPSNRNAVLFPEKIKGMYARLERPQDINGKGHTWISYSPDLIHWGNSRPLALPHLQWGSRKNGPGVPPIKTKKGWLSIYHATYMTASTENYNLGAMLLDLKDPSKVIACPNTFILAAEKDYECVGQVPNVVFTGGALETDDGTLNIYYGGADTRICLAQTTVERLVNYCLENK